MEKIMRNQIEVMQDKIESLTNEVESLSNILRQSDIEGIVKYMHHMDLWCAVEALTHSLLIGVPTVSNKDAALVLRHAGVEFIDETGENYDA